MKSMERRQLFTLAGVGSVVATGAAMPVVGRIATQEAPFVGRPVTLAFT